LDLLTVDDHADTNEAVNEYCKMHGIGCKMASQGLQGSFEIRKRDYDLILLDIAMPDYSGFDILKQLKKQAVQHKGIVILTGWNVKPEDFDDYLEVEVKEILKKPIGLDRLDNVVKSCLKNVRQVLQNDFVSNG
jgi:two-component system, OmpR family, response regulator